MIKAIIYYRAKRQPIPRSTRSIKCNCNITRFSREAAVPAVCNPLPIRVCYHLLLGSILHVTSKSSCRRGLSLISSLLFICLFPAPMRDRCLCSGWGTLVEAEEEPAWKVLEQQCRQSLPVVPGHTHERQVALLEWRRRRFDWSMDRRSMLIWLSPVLKMIDRKLVGPP